MMKTPAFCPCGGKIKLDKATRSWGCAKCKKSYDPHGKENKQEAINENSQNLHHPS